MAPAFRGRVDLRAMAEREGQSHMGGSQVVSHAAADEAGGGSGTAAAVPSAWSSGIFLCLADPPSNMLPSLKCLLYLAFQL